MFACFVWKKFDRQETSGGKNIRRTKKNKRKTELQRTETDIHLLDQLLLRTYCLEFFTSIFPFIEGDSVFTK